MDNLLSYFGLADVRINASDKDLPVLHNLNFPRKQPQIAVRSEHQHKSAVGQKKREKKETRVKRRGRKGQKKLYTNQEMTVKNLDIRLHLSL